MSAAHTPQLAANLLARIREDLGTLHHLLSILDLVGSEGGSKEWIRPRVRSLQESITLFVYQAYENYDRMRLALKTIGVVIEGSSEPDANICMDQLRRSSKLLANITAQDDLDDDEFEDLLDAARISLARTVEAADEAMPAIERFIQSTAAAQHLELSILSVGAEAWAPRRTPKITPRAVEA